MLDVETYFLHKYPWICQQGVHSRFQTCLMCFRAVIFVPLLENIALLLVFLVSFQTNGVCFRKFSTCQEGLTVLNEHFLKLIRLNRFLVLMVAGELRCGMLNFSTISKHTTTFTQQGFI